MPSDKRIVVVDGHAMNPGDLDYAPLAALGTLQVHAASGEALLAHCAGAQIVITNKERFDATTLAALPELEFIAVTATGYNIVDVRAARARKIPISNVPGYSTPSVAQQVFALLLELSNRTAEHVAASRDGRWTDSQCFSYTVAPIQELSGKTLGIIGYGAIGQEVARIALAFGMRVRVAERSAARSAPQSLRDGPSSMATPQLANTAGLVPGFPPLGAEQRVPLRQLFEESDVISLHCPLTRETENLVNRERLSWMKPSAFIINTGRGPLVDEDALQQALASGLIAGAGLDVLGREPPEKTHPLLCEPRCLITPHLAWASVEARKRLLQVTVDNVRAFLAGTPQHVVNP